MMGVKKNNTCSTWFTPFLLMSFFFFIIITIPTNVHGLKEESSSSMRLELVHRHDPRLFRGVKHSVERFARVKELAHRDMARIQRRRNWETFEMPMHAGRDYGSGEYFVQVKVGTPTQSFWLLADTGSDLTWVNCNPNPENVTHKDRSLRKPQHRVFHAHRSSSFQPLPCSSPQCKIDLKDFFSLAACPNPSSPCQYDFRYLDGSAASGFFGNEVITVGHRTGTKGKVKDMIIGCTRSINEGPALTRKIDGMLGLGLSEHSFVAKAASQYGGKFSYCLVDHLSHRNVSNFLTFGTEITTKSKLLTEIRRTPLVVIPPLYGLNMLGITIGGKNLRIPQRVWDFNANGGVILDSGTSLTFLTRPAYEPFANVLARSLEKFVKVKPFEPFDHCYNAKGFNESLMPRLVFHFGGGARFKPPVKSYLIDVSRDAKCIGVLGSDWPGLSTIGNIMQQNHVWEFDLDRKTVDFASSTCH